MCVNTICTRLKLFASQGEWIDIVEVNDIPVLMNFSFLMSFLLSPTSFTFSPHLLLYSFTPNNNILHNFDNTKGQSSISIVASSS